MDLNRLCKGCFHELPSAGAVCPHCGFDETEYERNRKQEVLPLNTILRGSYIVGKCLGKGGFGITYIGWHINLDSIVAIKEFFPSGVVSRNTTVSQSQQASSVYLIDSNFGQTYQKSLDGFINEAKTLGRLRLSGVVRVHDCFEENHTAYIVMDYVSGMSLSAYVKQQGGKIPEKSVLTIIQPVIRSLNALHENGIIHRDISPENLLLEKNGSITLVDFGSARTMSAQAMGENAAKSMTVVLKPGYAPIEQYNTHGYQGPWTDVYALCATIYKMLTGVTLEDPTSRTLNENDEYEIQKRMHEAGVSEHTIKVLIKGLQIKFKDRFQTVKELEEALYSAKSVKPPMETRKEEAPAPDRNGAGTASSLRPVEKEKWIVAIAAAAIVIIGTAIILISTQRQRNIRERERIAQKESQEASEKQSEKESQKLSEAESVEASEAVSEAEAQRNSERESQKESEAESQEASERASEEASEKASEEASEKASEEASEKASEEESQRISEKEAQEESEREAERAAKEAAIASAQIGDYITFGCCEQDNNISNGKEPIEWLVLDKQDNKTLVLSRYGLEVKAYTREWDNDTWENSDVRQRLNTTFYQAAFSEQERNLIEKTSVHEDASEDFEIQAASTTEDYLFLLSYEEVEQYRSWADSWVCYPSEFTRAQDANIPEESTGDCWWWLRTPGINSFLAVYSDLIEGSWVVSSGRDVHYERNVIRPAMWIRTNDLLNGYHSLEERGIASFSAGTRTMLESGSGQTLIYKMLPGDETAPEMGAEKETEQGGLTLVSQDGAYLVNDDIG